MSKNLRKLFQVFSTSSRPIVGLMDDMDAQVAEALRNAIVREKHAAIRSASVVLLSGYLESFLRQSAEIFFDEIHGKGVRYKELPKIMHRTHFISGVNNIQRSVKDDDEFFSKTILALKNLTDPVSNDLSKLYWNAFANTKGNPGPDVIKDYLRNFGVSDPFRVLAEKIRIDQNLIDITLNSFISLRNECAHTGTTRNTPTTSEVRDFVYFLRRLTLGISRALEGAVANTYAQALTYRATPP